MKGHILRKPKQPFKREFIHSSYMQEIVLVWIVCDLSKVQVSGKNRGILRDGIILIRRGENYSQCRSNNCPPNILGMNFLRFCVS